MDKVYVVTKGLKNDPHEIDSVWSTYELAEARIRQFDNDEYYEMYGSFMILQMKLDGVGLNV